MSDLKKNDVKVDHPKSFQEALVLWIGSRFGSTGVIIFLAVLATGIAAYGVYEMYRSYQLNQAMRANRWVNANGAAGIVYVRFNKHKVDTYRPDIVSGLAALVTSASVTQMCLFSLHRKIDLLMSGPDYLLRHFDATFDIPLAALHGVEVVPFDKFAFGSSPPQKVESDSDHSSDPHVVRLTISTSGSNSRAIKVSGPRPGQFGTPVPERLVSVDVILNHREPAESLAIEFRQAIAACQRIESLSLCDLHERCEVK